MILMYGEEKKGGGGWCYFLSQIRPLERIDYPLKDHENPI